MNRTLSLLALLPWITVVSSVASPSAPVQNDPAPTLRPQASMEELHFLSHDARINGLMYLAAGSGPHPIAIFLHGYPGNERNLDSTSRKQ